MENKIDKNEIAFNMFSRLSEDIRDYIALYESCGGANFSSVMKLASYIKETVERITIDTTGTEDVASGQGKDDTDDMEERDEPSGCGYWMVDLGLSVKWSDRNVGAESPEQAGDYFMWGSTEPDTNKPCDWSHAPFNDGSSAFDEAYFNARWPEWFTDKGTLKPEYDAAHAIMGGSWRMPTSAEMQELLDGTTRSVEELNGISGMRFTSKVNGNSIFMPFAGYRNGSDVDVVYTAGNVWSSSLDAGHDGNYSRSLNFSGYGSADATYDARYIGFVVRGVHE